MKKINFKQPKYIIPTIAYVGLLLIGYLVIDIFNVEISKPTDSSLKTTEYLNADLPQANVSNKIGSKRQNVKDVYGNITDLSAVQGIYENPDTLDKKEDFESKYSDADLKLLEEQRLQQEEINRLRELNAQLEASAKKGRSMSDGDFVLPMTDEERALALAKRREELMAEMGRDLSHVRSHGQSDADALQRAEDSIESATQMQEVKIQENAVHELDDTSKRNIVVKKSREDSDYFNTLSENASDNNLIKAIIDEEIKAVDGSRLRLRLLDDIEIDGTVVPKGSYLFATMSGFGQQRVKGNINSVLVGDQILKIGLSIYDTTDGLEGLYVPVSQFRETAKDVGSSALQGGSMNLGTSSGGNNLENWAGQALQNAFQRTSSAVSKAIKKNRVRLKYGTQVYLVNSKESKKR